MSRAPQTMCLRGLCLPGPKGCLMSIGLSRQAPTHKLLPACTRFTQSAREPASYTQQVNSPVARHFLHILYHWFLRISSKNISRESCSTCTGWWVTFSTFLFIFELVLAEWNWLIWTKKVSVDYHSIWTGREIQILSKGGGFLYKYSIFTIWLCRLLFLQS